jgi:hypothetical protein
MERMSELVKACLAPQQLRVMGHVLADEERRREHVVVYLSGAHAYGFPSPDSDLDLKAIHVARTADLLGFEPPPPTVDRAEVIDGVEIDYTSNEIAHALSGVLAGNGNFLERILGRLAPLEGSVLGDLRPLVRRSLSRRVHRHYRGFAQNQLRFLESEPTAKKLLYVLRTALTGIHLLETGELEPDLTVLMEGHGVADAAALVERKRAGERVALPDGELGRWRSRIDGLFRRLDEARERSVLPADPPNEAEIRAWLLDLRRARL